MQTKILYITDDEDELNATAELMQDKGIQVLKAQNVKQAWQVIQNETTIVLILVGLEMSYATDFIEEPDCSHIPKILLTVEVEEVEERLPSVVATLSMQDSNRWDRLAELVNDLSN